MSSYSLTTKSVLLVNFVFNYFEYRMNFKEISISYICNQIQFKLFNFIKYIINFKSPIKFKIKHK